MPLTWTNEELAVGDIGRHQANFEIVGRSAGKFNLSIGNVLFPLRYDIYVQAQYFEFYEENKAKGRDWLLDNIPLYMKRRIDVVHDLRRKWGYIVNMPNAKWLRRKAKYSQANVEVLIDLWEKVKKEGYLGNTKGKLQFRHDLEPTQTLEGHVPPEGYFLTHGQHRMVVLLALGYKEIPAEWHSITTVRSFRAIETTCEYIKRHWISEAEFVDFARLRFPQIPDEVVTIRDLRKRDLPEWFQYYLKEYWG